MKPLEIVSRMCDVVNEIYDIARAQQEDIERSDIPESVKKDMRERMRNAADKLDVIEYQSRGVIDVDDGEPITEEVRLHEVTVVTEHKLLIEAAGKAAAAEQARKEFAAMTHITPKEVYVSGVGKGEGD